MDKQKLLQDKRLRVTTARVAVLDALEKKNNPSDVLSLVEDLNTIVDQATIYRTLDLFTDKGVIKRIDFGEGKYRYELQKKHHHHLVCSSCGLVEDIKIEDLDRLEEKVKIKKGFLVKSHSLEFFGICMNCQH